MSVDRQCVLCGRPVDPADPYVWHGVRGFERRAGTRASGKQGGSDIALRRKVDEFAHPSCVRLAQDGVNANQESLL